MTADSELEQLRAVHRLVEAYRRYITDRYGSCPTLWSDEWWDAAPAAQLAGLLPLAEAWLVVDPERMAAERLRGMSHDLSGALDWSAEAERLPYSGLQALRSVRVTPIRCSHPGCREVVSVQHPLPPDLGTVRCHRHTKPTEAAA